MVKLPFSGSAHFFFLLMFQTNMATNTAYCPPSSCGRTNISYPFRLQTDPVSCGDDKYMLSCGNDLTILHLINGGKYYVQAINYKNFTIRLVDAGVDKDDCSSIPSFLLTSDSFSLGDSYTLYRYEQEKFAGIDLRDGCSLEMVSLLPKRDDSVGKNSSFIEIHRKLAFGFELSWHNINCRHCSSGLCYQDSKHYFHCQHAGYVRELIIKILGMFLVARTLCGAPCLAAFLIYKLGRRHLSEYETIEEFLQTQNNLMPIRYAYSDIKKMTGGFKEMLGKGGFGSVYKGKLRSGHFAAIKMLDKSKADGQDFINEVSTIGRIHHANVVRLIGFCSDGSKNALIYEFMSNGSLDSHIFSQERSIILSWEKLYEISFGVARGIEYLHRGCEIQILHFDIKPHNILLNEYFTPKISDFGLAKFYPTGRSIAPLTAARGTIGYMASELFYKNIGRVSYKADVYRLWCIQMHPSERPPMNKVVEMLEGNMQNLDLPPRPILYPGEPMGKDDGESVSISVEFEESSSLIQNPS
ncbi:PR5-like receptor kinase [Euphorbia peplus]|nr:PR5-like receptor kinase [Euphorbia peplus]